MNDSHSLRSLANTLWREAHKQPGVWHDSFLDAIDQTWKIGLLVEPDTGRLGVRFRVLAGCGLTRAEFEVQARVYAAQLEAVAWDTQFRYEGLLWEASFLQPIAVQTSAM